VSRVDPTLAIFTTFSAKVTEHVAIVSAGTDALSGSDLDELLISHQFLAIGKHDDEERLLDLLTLRHRLSSPIIRFFIYSSGLYVQP